MFKRILIANRGEIACRIIKTARRMGIETVAVYSEADKDALHVEMADTAIAIGPPRSRQELPADRQDRGGLQGVAAPRPCIPATASCPNARPSPRRWRSAGVVFIGPNPKAIAAMGDKIEFEESGGRRQGLDRARPSRRHRRRRRGDGDRRRDRLSGDDQGLRRRRRQGHAHRLFTRPRWRKVSRARKSEAKSSFGDDRMFIEKFITDPRHIEIQVLGDKHGNVIYLGERECSIQRRNQKVIEEAPSPLLDAATRKKMGEQAVALAKAVGYDSAGTVEFVAGQDKSFYFLEMNTRLQVEHPVTELVTGIDLVEQMIRSAAGEKLVAQAERREAQRLGGRKPRLCRGPVPQFPALDRPPDALPPAGGAQRQRRHRAQRHRRLRGRRDFDLLRSDDRQAGDARADARSRRSTRRPTRSMLSSSTASATIFRFSRR